MIEGQNQLGQSGVLLAQPDITKVGNQNVLKPRLVQGLNKLNIFGVQGSTKLRGKDTINEKT